MAECQPIRNCIMKHENQRHATTAVGRNGTWSMCQRKGPTFPKGVPFVAFCHLMGNYITLGNLNRNLTFRSGVSFSKEFRRGPGVGRGGRKLKISEGRKCARPSGQVPTGPPDHERPGGREGGRVRALQKRVCYLGVLVLRLF